MPPLQRNCETEATVGAGYIPPLSASVLDEPNHPSCHPDRGPQRPSGGICETRAGPRCRLTHRFLDSLRSLGMTARAARAINLPSAGGPADGLGPTGAARTIRTETKVVGARGMRAEPTSPLFKRRRRGRYLAWGVNPPAAAKCGRGRGPPAIGHSLVTVRHDGRGPSVTPGAEINLKLKPPEGATDLWLFVFNSMFLQLATKE